MTATIDSTESVSRPAGTPNGTRPLRVGDTSRPRPKMGYLPALDGLRAIAVLAVLFFHADVSWMPGGFLGVDVFFVLSGFLITTLLLEATAKLGSPDMKQFYLRRARRLLPALFALLIGSTLLVVTVATDDAAHQQRDLPAALTYVTNWVYVFTDQSYFEATGRPPMLEHLWSLAVEEQFYLIWPWVFLLAWRTGRNQRVRRVAAIGAVVSTLLMAVISIMNGYPTEADPSRVYFGTDTHAMGLLTGAALATLWIPRTARANLRAGARAIIDATGAVCLILLAWVFWQTEYDSPLLFRGGFLMLSILVAVLIVAVTHPASRVSWLLGTAPMRYIGTRSYGIYLWHWPIFLVTRPGLDVPLTGAANLMLRFALTFAIAELSYRYLETPIRKYGFAGAWRAFLTMLQVRGGVFAKAAARPVLIAALASGLLAVVLLRLYTIPPQEDYLDGVTSLSAAPAPQPSASASPAAEPQPAGTPTPQPTGAAIPLPDGVLAIGESVMLGAQKSVNDQFPGVSIDASVARQPDDTVAKIDELIASGSAREQVIVHMGSNGNIGPNALRHVLSSLTAAGVDRIVLVNVSVPRRWQDENNAIIAQVAPEFPNVAVADWHAAVVASPSLVVADGIHPTIAGAKTYATLISEAFASLPATAPAPATGTGDGNDGEPALQDESEVTNHPALVND